MKKIAALIFLLLIGSVQAANTPPPGANTDVIYNNNGQWGPYKLGSGLVVTTSGGNKFLNSTSSGGGGGTPGGSYPQLQYNAGVTFGGLSSNTLAAYAAHDTVMNGLAYDPRNPTYGAICKAPNTFSGDGHTMTFNYTIPFTGSTSTDNSAFYVYVTPSVGSATILTTSDFSVTGVNSGVGGTITLNSAPAVGSTVTVLHDDTAAILAAGTAAAASGGYVAAPNNCWIRDMTWVNGGSIIGAGFSPNYDFLAQTQKPVWNIINPVGHNPAFGINLGLPYIQQAFFEGFDLKGLYATTPVCIGTNAGFGGNAAPGVILQYMNIENCVVGFGAQVGGSSSYMFAAARYNNFSDNGYGIYGPFSDPKFVGNIYTSNYLDGMHLGPQLSAVGVSAAGQFSNERVEYNGQNGIYCDSCAAENFENMQIDGNAGCGLNLSGAWNTITMLGGYFTGSANGGYPSYAGNTSAGHDAHICFNGTSSSGGSLHINGVNFTTNYAIGHVAPLGSVNATTPPYVLDFTTTGTNNDNVTIENGDAKFAPGVNGASVTDFSIFRNSRPPHMNLDLYGQAVQGRLISGNFTGQVRGIPTNQWTSVNIFGDATSNNNQFQPINRGYGGLIAKQLGAAPTYYVINDFSHFDCDIVDQKIIPNVNPTQSNNPLLVWLPTPQEAAFGGGFYQAHLIDDTTCHMGALTWSTIARDNKVYGQNFSLTGTWSNNSHYTIPAGSTSNTNGDTASGTITTYGGPIYLWFLMHGADGGTFTYNLDGGPTLGTVATVGQNAFTFPISSSSYSLGAVRIPVNTAGSHTVNIAVSSTTSVSNTVTIEGIGTPSGKSYSAKAPVIVFGGQIPLAAWPAASTAFQNSYLTLTNQLTVDGLMVPFADVTAYYNDSTDLFPGGGFNTTGQSHIAQAFNGVIQGARNTDGSVNPIDFGASCNSLYFASSYCSTCNNVSTTAGSPTISVANYTFQPGIATQSGGGDVGKRFCIGRGPSGAAEGPCTYVASVSSNGATANLGVNMISTQSSNYGVMGGYPTNPNDPSTAQDDTNYIQAAGNAALLNGGSVALPTNCMVHNLAMPANIWVHGNGPGDFYGQTAQELTKTQQETILNCGMTGFADDSPQCVQSTPHTRFSNFMFRAPTFPYQGYGLSAACLGYSTAGTGNGGPGSQSITDHLSFFGCPVDIGQAYGYNYQIGFTASIADNGDGTSTMSVSSVDTTNFYTADFWSANGAAHNDFLALNRTVSGPGVTTGTKIISVPVNGSGQTGVTGDYILDHALTVSSTSLVSPRSTILMELRDDHSQHYVAGIGYNGDFSDSVINDSVCTGTFMNGCWRLGPNVSGSGNGGNRWTGGRMEEQSVSAVTCDGCEIKLTGADLDFNGGYNIRTLGTNPTVQMTGGNLTGGGHCSGFQNTSINVGGTNPNISIDGVELVSADFGSGCGGTTTYLFATATGSGATTGGYLSVTGGAAHVGGVGGTMTGLYNWANGTAKFYKQDVAGWPYIDTTQTALGATASGNITTGSSSILAVGNGAAGSYALGATTTLGNTVYGFNALRVATSTADSTALGYSALVALTTGNDNTAVGFNSLKGVTVGSTNTAIGSSSGSKITTGGSNVVIGPNVASTTLTIGSNNILIGTTSAIDATTSATNNQLNIGGVVQADTSVKTVWLGAGSLTTTATDGFVFIPSSAGPPTGTPTSHSGFIPLDIDTSNNALYFYNSGWRNISSGVSAALSSLTSATTGNSIDNTSFAQSWSWSALAGNTGLSLAGTTTQAGIGLSVTITGTANIGDAGYFSNTSTAGYALYSNGPFAINSTYTSPNLITSSGVFGTTEPLHALGATTTIYTILASDMTKTVLFNTTTAAAVTLPQAGTTGFGSGAAFTALNIGTVNVVVTPTTSTLNGAAALTLTGCSTPPICSWGYFISDGTNWDVLVK